MHYMQSQVEVPINSKSYAERLVEILKLFAEGPDVLSIGEISERLHLAPSSTHRLLCSLVDQGLIDRAPKRRYRVGTEFFRVAAIVETRYGLLAAAKPIVTGIAEASGETCLLGILAHTRSRMILAHKVDAVYPLGFKFDLFSNISPVWGSLGRAMMAWLEPAELRRVLSEADASPVTREALPEPKILADEFAAIRQRGIARSLGQRAAPDAIGVSSPVFDAKGMVCAAIGVVTPQHRLSPDLERQVTRLVRSGAARLSHLMAHADHMQDLQ